MLTKAMHAAIKTALSRDRGAYCPVVTHRGRINAAAEQAMLDALDRRGFVRWQGPVPMANDAARDAIKAA